MSAQTKLSDGAAVNAESAAKLVSDEQIECAAKAIYDHYLFRDSTITPTWVDRGNSHQQDTARTFARVALEAASLIERHATPQTQATHSEGEAVAYITSADLEWLLSSLSNTARIFRQNIHSFDVPLYTRPAPSPTAAPALGELAKRLIARAKASAYLGNPHTEYADLMLEAAAALSGVAASGERAQRKWFDPALLPAPDQNNYNFVNHPDSLLKIWCNGEPDNEAPIDPERGIELGLEFAFTVEDCEYPNDDICAGDMLPMKYPPAAPSGAGWRLAASYNTEDGNVAWWVRDIASTSPVSGVAAQGDGEARVSEDAEFQLYCDDEPVAVASGPRKEALREIQHYALQYNQYGAVRIEEVIRKPQSAIEDVRSLGVADQEVQPT